MDNKLIDLKDQDLLKLQEQLFTFVNASLANVENELTSAVNLPPLPRLPLYQEGELTLLNDYDDFMEQGQTMFYEVVGSRIVLDETFEFDLVNFVSNVAYVEKVRDKEEAAHV